VIRRRLALQLVGLVATSGIAVLPAAHATESTPATRVTVPARTWGCAWLDVVHVAYCIGR
jgi:hypothetical protein